MRAYVDGFNLDYGSLKGTAWTWLDLLAPFAKIAQPHQDILTAGRIGDSELHQA